MDVIDLGFTLEISYRTRYLENTIISPGTQTEIDDGILQQIGCRLIDLADLTDQLRRHIGIGMHVIVCSEAACLYIPGSLDAFPDGG